MNPFLVSGYEGPEFFCDRENETKRIIQSIENSRNLTLISERRMGKTSLLKHLMFLQQNEATFIYIDIYPTLSMSDFIRILSNAVLNHLEPFSEKVIRKLTNFFSAFKPKFSIDPHSGSPNLELSIVNTSEKEKSLSLLFEYIRESEKKLVVIFDEFQQITKYPEKNVEALLRSEIQKDANTSFIFSGSQTSILLSMFNSYSRPFYNSTETLYLDAIQKAEYSAFIVNKFAGKNFEIAAETASYLYELNRGITYNVQYLCHKLFADDKQPITRESAEDKLTQILQENEVVYYNYRELLTSFQFQLLQAIAHQGIVEKPYGSAFIQDYSLVSASSVRTAINSLLEKGFLIQQKGVYLSDWYFSLWLQRQL